MIRPRLKAFFVGTSLVYLLVITMILIHLETFQSKMANQLDNEGMALAMVVQEQLLAGVNNSLVAYSTTMTSYRPTSTIRLQEQTSAIKQEYYLPQENISRFEPSISLENFNFTLVSDKFYIYSAFYDRRQSGSFFIRIVALALRGFGKTPTGHWCFFFVPGRSQYLQSELVYYESCEPHGKRDAFYFLSCQLPKLEANETWTDNQVYVGNNKNMTKVPVIRYDWVEKSGRPWDKGHDPTSPQSFSVCVPPIFGQPDLTNFVEFVELSMLLGAQHFTVYDTGVSSAFRTILQNYSSIGLISILPWHIPDILETWYHGQSAAIADCLLRQMYSYDLVMFQDIDEVIFPHKGTSWQSMIESLYCESGCQNLTRNHSESLGSKTAGYRFQSAFFESTPKKNADNSSQDEGRHLQSMTRLVRQSRPSNFRTKMMADPVRVFELGIHHLSKPMQEHFEARTVPVEIGLLHHYRQCQGGFDVICTDKVVDTTAMQFKVDLLKRMSFRVKDMKLKGLVKL